MYQNVTDGHAIDISHNNSTRVSRKQIESKKVAVMDGGNKS